MLNDDDADDAGEWWLEREGVLGRPRPGVGPGGGVLENCWRPIE